MCTVLTVSEALYGFVAFPKTMAGVGHLKRICTDTFSVAGTVQETCSSEMLGGQCADFLRRVAFWSIRSLQVCQDDIFRGRCSTSYDLASLFRGRRQYFRQVQWKNRKTHWYKAVSSALKLSMFEGRLAESLRF